MKCKYCNTENEDDAIYCKKCGKSLYQEDSSDKKIKNNNNKKPKTKTKVKKKVKKVKVKNKKRKDKSDKKMSFGQKLLLIIMTLIIIILLGACLIGGYYYYQEQNIEVPNLVGLSYHEAELKLAESNIKAVKIEQEVLDIEDDDIVIKQNKTSGTKVSKNSKIKLTVGVIKKYELPSFIGKNLEDAKEELENNHLKYKIEYKESEKDTDIILEQNPAKKTKLNPGEIVTLVVSKKIKIRNNDKQSNDTEQKDEEDDNKNDKDIIDDNE